MSGGEVMGVSDTIAFVAFVTAWVAILQGVVVVYYKSELNKYRAERQDALKRSMQNETYLKIFHEVVLSTFSEITAVQRLYGALIYRIAEHGQLPIRDAVAKEIGEYDHSIEKSVYELNLFSADSIKRQSSIRSLSEEYGDIASLELLNLCNSRFYNDEDSDIKEGIKHLRRRLEKKLSQGAEGG